MEVLAVRGIPFEIVHTGNVNSASQLVNAIYRRNDEVGYAHDFRVIAQTDGGISKELRDVLDVHNLHEGMVNGLQRQAVGNAHVWRPVQVAAAGGAVQVVAGQPAGTQIVSDRNIFSGLVLRLLQHPTVAPGGTPLPDLRELMDAKKNNDFEKWQEYGLQYLLKPDRVRAPAARENDAYELLAANNMEYVPGSKPGGAVVYSGLFCLARENYRAVIRTPEVDDILDADPDADLGYMAWTLLVHYDPKNGKKRHYPLPLNSFYIKLYMLEYQSVFGLGADVRVAARFLRGRARLAVKTNVKATRASQERAGAGLPVSF